MMRTRTWVALVAAVVAMLAPTVSAAVPPELERDLRTAEQRLEELDAQLSAVVEDFNEASAQLADLEEQRDRASERVAALAAEVTRLEERTGAFLRTLYMHGPTFELEVAFGTGGPDEVGRDLAVLDRLARQQQTELERLAVRRDELDEARRTLDDQISAASEHERQLAAARDRVEQTVERQRDELDELRDRVTEIRAQEEAERRRRIEAERRAAAQVAAPQPQPVPVAAPQPAPVGTRRGADAAVQAALSQLGKPYRYGAEGPDSYDCSGLTLWAWRHAGVSLPHSSRMQFAATARISRADLQPGDLIFFGSPIHHVAMYIGDGKVVEAPYTGATVRVNDRSLSRSDIAGYGRVR